MAQSVAKRVTITAKEGRWARAWRLGKRVEAANMSEILKADVRHLDREGIGRVSSH